MRCCYFDKISQDEQGQARASRKDLTGRPAQAKIEWRKIRARNYSKNARERTKAVIAMTTQEVRGLQIFRTLVEEAPHILFVLSRDLNCQVLYVNASINRLLHIKTSSMLGRWVCNVSNALIQIRYSPGFKELTTLATLP